MGVDMEAILEFKHSSSGPWEHFAILNVPRNRQRFDIFAEIPKGLPSDLTYRSQSHVKWAHQDECSWMGRDEVQTHHKAYLETFCDESVTEWQAEDNNVWETIILCMDRFYAARLVFGFNA